MSRMPSDADRNLLLGLVALELDFVVREGLVAALNTWALDKGRPLGTILVEQGAAEPTDLGALEPMIDRHIERHGGDLKVCLAALDLGRGAAAALAEVADPELKARLALLAPEEIRVAAGGAETVSAAPGQGPGQPADLGFSVLAAAGAGFALPRAPPARPGRPGAGVPGRATRSWAGRWP